MQLLDLAKRLISFKTYHGNPEAFKDCLDFCIEFFKENNIFIKRYSSQGIESIVISSQDTLTPDILFLGHVDTIEAPSKYYVPKVEDGKLYGIGSLDMKAFVATSMTAFKELLQQNSKLSIALMVVTDEELGGVYGARYLVEEIGYRPKLVLVPDDGEQLNNLVVNSKHILQIQFKATGKAAHGCQPWAGENAIEALLMTYQNIRERLSKFNIKPSPENEWVSTFNLGKISGGVASNEVPAEASMDIDFRLIPSMVKEKLLDTIRECCSSGVVFEVKTEGFPTRLDASSEVVKLYKSCMIAVTKQPVVEFYSGGGTDGRYFASKGIPVIVHQGSGGNCQAYDEFVYVDDLQKLVDIQKAFITQLIGSDLLNNNGKK